MKKRVVILIFFLFLNKNFLVSRFQEMIYWNEF